MSKLPFKVDKRFDICKREMILAFVFQFVYMVAMNLIIFVWGGKSMSEYNFILGMPSWLFACFVVVVVFLIILAYLCFHHLKNISIEAYVQDEGGNE